MPAVIPNELASKDVESDAVTLAQQGKLYILYNARFNGSLCRKAKRIQWHSSYKIRHTLTKDRKKWTAQESVLIYLKQQIVFVPSKITKMPLH